MSEFVKKVLYSQSEKKSNKVESQKSNFSASRAQSNLFELPRRSLKS
jgi:hypothetical protein